MKKQPPDFNPTSPSEFDPPRPRKETALETGGAMAASIAGFGAAVALDVCTGGILSSLAAIPGMGDDEHIDLTALEARVPGLAETSAPHLTDDQKVVCTRCGEAVLFASMSLSEHGYFCATCASHIG